MAKNGAWQRMISQPSPPCATGVSADYFLVGFLVGWFSAPLEAQTATVIPDTEAIHRVGQQATVEGTVVKVFISKNGNTFLNLGAAYPNQTFAGWIPKDSPLVADESLSALVAHRSHNRSHHDTH
jgi:hypothetical protein